MMRSKRASILSTLDKTLTTLQYLVCTEVINEMIILRCFSMMFMMSLDVILSSNSPRRIFYQFLKFLEGNCTQHIKPTVFRDLSIRRCLPFSSIVLNEIKKT